MPKITLMFAALFAFLPLSAQAASELSYDYDGKVYSGKTLPPAILNQLYELDMKVNEERQQIVDRHILEVYFRDLAKAEGKTVDEVAAKVLDVPEPDEKAIRAFYDENWETIQQPFDEVKDQLKTLVWNQDQQKKVLEVVKQIGIDKQYKVHLPIPDAPTFEIKTEGHPSLGDADAPVTVVEFADFQCPHCKDADEALRKMVADKGLKMRLVYRHMPINPSGISRKVAEGSVCAGQQGKFWEYHDLAFEVQGKLNNDSPLNLAKETKLDEEAFKTCMEDPKTAEAVDASEQEGSQLGITGTPAFFINGKPFQPQFELEGELLAAIKAALPKEENAGEAKPEAKPAETAVTGDAKPEEAKAEEKAEDAAATEKAPEEKPAE